MHPRVRSDNSRSGTGLFEKIDFFLKVVELGSFSKAAQVLQTSASTISRQIALLEQHLGATLLRRSTRTISLTEAGSVLHEHGRTLVTRLDELRARLEETQVRPSGILTVEAPKSFGALHVADAVFLFMQKYPDIRVVLRLNDEMVDLVGAGVDIAVRIGKLPDSGLISVKLAPQVRFACAAPSYLERRGIPLTPTDLVRHDCLATPGQPAVGWWRFGPGGEAVSSIRPVLVCDNTSVLVQAAVAGLGVVHLPTWLVANWLHQGKLVRLFDDLAVFPEDTGIFLVRPNGHAPTKVIKFIEHLKQHVGSPPYWDAKSPMRM